MPKIPRAEGHLHAAPDLHFSVEKYRGSHGFDFSNQAGLLATSLQAAVPLWILELQEMRQRLGGKAFWDRIRERAEECAAAIAEHGDALMFRVKGKSAEAFNRLAEGVACMAWLPGGVTIFGTHWEVTGQEQTGD